MSNPVLVTPGAGSVTSTLRTITRTVLEAPILYVQSLTCYRQWILVDWVQYARIAKHDILPLHECIEYNLKESLVAQMMLSEVDFDNLSQANQIGSTRQNISRKSLSSSTIWTY